MNENEPILFDAGVFIGALLKGDRRHQEARYADIVRLILPRNSQLVARITSVIPRL